MTVDHDARRRHMLAFMASHRNGHDHVVVRDGFTDQYSREAITDERAWDLFREAGMPELAHDR